MTPRSDGAALPVAPIEPANPGRGPVRGARDVHAQLADQRGPPLLVSLYAELLGDTGLLGPPARLRIARFAMRSIPASVALAGGALVDARFYASSPTAPPQLAAASALLATAGVVAWRRCSAAVAGRAATWRENLELGALLLVVAFTLAQASAALPAREEPLRPLVYLVIAALVSILPRGPALVLAASAVGFEALYWWTGGAEPDEGWAAAGRAAFVVTFAGLHHGLLGARVAAGRRAEKAALERRRRELDERSRQLRLLAATERAPEPGAGDRAERLGEAVVLETDAAARSILEIAEAVFGAHTAAAWLLTEDDSELRLWECRSASERVARTLPAGEGPLGGVVRRRAALRLHGDVRAANHYEDGARPRALLAVPLLSRVGGHLRGVVLVDRATPTPFTEDDERTLAKLAAELARSAAAERLIHDGRETRAEQERFYQAMERLNKTTKPREVFDAVIEVASELVPVEFAAVTLVEGIGDAVRHRVSRAVTSTGAPRSRGAGAAGAFQSFAELEGKEFPDNGGLVSCAVRLGSALPAKALDLDEAVVFGDTTRIRGLASLKVVPLRSGDTMLGAVVLGAKAAAAYPPDAVRQLEAIAMQAGDSILRARLFEATERLATTDGLTGLVNHRTFQSRLDEHLAAAQRYGKKVSLLLTDIDHFKSVNDTYGHPVGDVVLREVARILQREARTTDVAARYGGEEFALVMPETDLAGALKTAERIREKVGKACFKTDQGELRITLSVGVATFPGDATTKAQLIERADGGLYHAKRHGRNQSVALAALRKR